MIVALLVVALLAIFFRGILRAIFVALALLLLVVVVLVAV